jgi:hypothetical protein
VAADQPARFAAPEGRERVEVQRRRFLRRKLPGRPQARRLGREFSATGDLVEPDKLEKTVVGRAAFGGGQDAARTRSRFRRAEP